MPGSTPSSVRLASWLVAAILALPAGDARAETPARIATWNLQTVGLPGSLEYNAALAVLNRLRPDLLGVQEVASAADEGNLQQLAADAGYPYTVVPPGGPFGALRCAVLSRWPLRQQTINDSPGLSGDPLANDIARYLVEVTVDVPGESVGLTLVVTHWTSGGTDQEEMRRAVESYRMAQAVADLSSANESYVLVGDVNEEIDNVPQSPDPFTSLPPGLPGSFSLGLDLQAVLAGPGIRNDPFVYLVGTTALPALQLDGLDATRPASGRRLDYIFASDAIVLRGYRAEVYDSVDEGLPGGLPKTGLPLPAQTCGDASDHLPVFADIRVGEVVRTDILRFLAKTDLPSFPERVFANQPLPFEDPDMVLNAAVPLYFYQATSVSAPIRLVKTAQSIAIR